MLPPSRASMVRILVLIRTTREDVLEADWSLSVSLSFVIVKRS